MHTTNHLSRLLFCAGMLLTAGAQAQSEVIKCVNASGEVTLTNTPCDSGSVVQAVAPPARPPSQTGLRMIAQRAPLPSGAWAQTAIVQAKPSRDATTLKAAWLSLQEADRRNHPQRIASAD